MKKLLLIFLYLVCCAAIANAQTKPVKEYYDKDFKRVPSDKASYYRMVTRNDSGHAIGIVHDYYISGAIQWVGHLDMNDQPDGPAVWYYENGQKQTESDNTHGYNIGHYRDYFPDGKLHTEGNYVHGEWQTEKRGNWTIYYENGKPEMKLHYTKHRKGGAVAEDVRDSICSLFYPDGKLLATGWFEDGYLAGIGKYYDTTGKEHLIFMEPGKFPDLIGFVGELTGINDGATKNNYLPFDIGNLTQQQQGDNKSSPLYRKYYAFECKEGKNSINDDFDNDRYEFTIKNGDFEGEYSATFKEGGIERGIFKNGILKGGSRQLLESLGMAQFG